MLPCGRERFETMKKTGRIYWNDNWQFASVYEETMLKPEFDASGLELVRLPHSTVEMPFHYFDEQIYQTVCGYRRVFMPEADWQGKHVFLTVEAAGHAARVFCNGVCVGEHHCGYTAFTVDLAAHLLWDRENVLVIRVDSRENLNQPPFGNVIDYMTYGGLYREVWLEIKEEAYIEDVFAATHRLVPDAQGIFGEAELDCQVLVQNGKGMVIRQELLETEGEITVAALERPADVSGSKRLVHKLDRVRLWHPLHPALYELRTLLLKDGQVVDERRDRIGVRTVDFGAEGLFINGQKVTVRGLNRHQSYPYTGYAMPASIQRRDAEILKKELGLNAVRTSHYPQSQHFVDACDELGLLVFTEIPGWQHIGDEAWKEQAVKNTADMVLQYRNHPSVFLWGVRINESMDDDALYRRTNDLAHSLDHTRPTGGVRYIQKSSLLEDVYTFNDFSHDGKTAGCLKRTRVTPDKNKGYMITEYGGHMFPTKSFDTEDHRVAHMQRHAKVMDAYYGQEGVAGGFGWCMADYNTHKDFGSGDRICYHGVLDMFRNPKQAAYLYASQAEGEEAVLEITSSMDIGEHPACQSPGVFALTNADSVRVYKNGQFVGEYGKEASPYRNLPHGPIYIDDFIGELMEKGEGFSPQKAKDIKKVLIAANKHGMSHLPPAAKLTAAKCMLVHGMKIADAVDLYGKYITNWGQNVTTYRFEAVKNGHVVKAVEKKPVNKVSLAVDVSHTLLKEESTYDVAAVRIRAVDDCGAVLPFYQEPVQLETQGPISLIGPGYGVMRGGMGGTYVRTPGEKGKAVLKIRMSNGESTEIVFEVN